MKPHCNNACSGKYPDWLEVNLLPQCNAKCSWCIEKKGWHPTNQTKWWNIANAAINSGVKNVILLGGEPTLYPHLKRVIDKITKEGIKVWITTNGSLLNREFVMSELKGISGVNISIHHYLLAKNKDITGIDISYPVLADAISALHEIGATVRLNCNCIKDNIDSISAINMYIEFANSLSVDSVRFAELKNSDDIFVNLADLYKGKHGLTNDPFIDGCSINTTINDMRVNFRLMCGLQTNLRPKPDNPEQVPHDVLYYDGKFYKGWQIRGEVKPITSETPDMVDVLGSVTNGNMTFTQAVQALGITSVEIIKALKRLQDGVETLVEVALMIQKEELDKQAKIAIQYAAQTGAGCAY